MSPYRQQLAVVSRDTAAKNKAIANANLAEKERKAIAKAEKNADKYLDYTLKHIAKVAARGKTDTEYHPFFFFLPFHPWNLYMIQAVCDRLRLLGYSAQGGWPYHKLNISWATTNE